MGKTDRAEVTIIVPVRDRAAIVGRTLTSIAAQTHRPLRLILVDNGSTDGTMATLSQFKSDHERGRLTVDVLSEPRPGATVARNTGLRAARSEWVMFFDSDDTMEPGLVEAYMSKIAASSLEPDIVVTRCDAVLPGGRMRRLPYFECHDDPMKYQLFDSILSTQRFMARRGLLEAAGGWNESLPRWNDWELGVRLLLQRPRLAFMGERTLVHTFFTPVSITGASKAERCGDWELSLDAVEALLRQSDLPARDRYLKYVECRRVILAGTYKREGHREQARRLMAQVMSRQGSNAATRLIFTVMFRWTGMGLPGASRMAKALIR